MSIHSTQCFRRSRYSASSARISGASGSASLEMRAVSAGGRPLPPAYHSVVETSFTNQPGDEEAAVGGDDPPPDYQELHPGTYIR